MMLYGPGASEAEVHILHIYKYEFLVNITPYSPKYMYQKLFDMLYFQSL